MKLVEGEDASFTLKITGTPTPAITWTVNGKALIPSKRVSFTIENGYATLNIKKVITDDENSYTIRVVNDHGEDQETVSLTIISMFNYIIIGTL